MLRNWLQIQPATPNGIVIQEPLDFQASVIRNQIWYRGEAAELEQLYKQLGAQDSTNASRFWAAVPANAMKLRKIHSGLPAILVDTLAYLVKSDMDDVAFKDNCGEAEWKAITEELDFQDTVGQGVAGALKAADGAWKISIDITVSQYPIVEFYEADRVEYIQSRGRVIGVKFWSDHSDGYKVYRLCEEYGKGYVSYALYDGTSEVPLDRIPELAELKPVAFDGDFMMAVPFKVFESAKFPGRGKALYESKLDSFDALDEVISQWWDAMRAGRVKKYIPRDLLPVDPKTGNLLPLNDFGSEYITTESLTDENGVSRIDTIQPEIRYEAFLSSYTAALDMCLQGVVSPATLGIDVGKMSSAEAQREKKDVTGYTRNTITGVLEKVLPQLVSTILMVNDLMQGRAPGNYEPSVGFGEYGAPSFDSRVETVNRAAAANTMSIETQVDELWGNSKDDGWKTGEVARIKQLRGIETVDGPPAVGDELA
ncbi:hypothetical protein [Anaeromassilibacillus senegalensis]|uniref:hypothetical protein n=1 Tax=Anaeromassilibacillus senegalensis TaxID=1673717 RepID=UPI00068040EE|nr:hypothetical protein [Anaeromassilibacillus senegalensis]